MNRFRPCLVRGLVLLLLAVLATACMAVPKSHTPTAGVQPEFSPERILVKPKANSLPEVAKLHAANRAAVLRQFKGIGNLQIVKLPKGANVNTVLARYRKSGLVEYAEPDYIVHADATIPNDPSFGDLWGLHNTGQTGPTGIAGTVDADIDAPEAWDTIRNAVFPTGEDIVVAVIDSGVDYNHPDLVDNIWINPGELPEDNYDDDNNGFADDMNGICAIPNYCDPITYRCQAANDPMDDNGHGTHVAGIIAGVGNNGVGVTGVAWNVKIMACKFLDAYGNGLISNAITCVDYARVSGAHIMNNSWGGGGYSQALVDAIAAARDAGIIFVAAAGNNGADNDVYEFYPSSYAVDNIVSVGASDRNDALADFSNYGATSVDLTAPGVEILSTFYDLSTAYEGYEYLSGTSMATPMVSGAFALLKALHPNDTCAQLITRVLESVDQIPGLAGMCATGGRLNLNSAVTWTPPALHVTPDEGLVLGGMPGGPYSTPKTYTVTNYGAADITWSAAAAQPWLTISPASGTLAPNQSATVTVSVNSNADTLAAGTHSNTINFVNVTDGSGNTSRSVSLTLGGFYVKTDGNDANDGATWATAKRTVQAAIDVALQGQEVWVAAGTYAEHITTKSGIALYGGFSGTETTRSQRNWRTNITVLDGTYNGKVVIVPQNADSGTRIDGFTVRHGLGAIDAGITCDTGSSPVIANNIITENSGGGIYLVTSSATIKNNMIVANQGSGLRMDDNSTPLVYNNTIVGNSEHWLTDGSTTWQAGAVTLLDSSAPTMVNNIIAFNGAGIYKDAASTVTLRNNDVYGNTSFDYSWTPAPTGTNGNISVDPKLAGSMYGNCHIQPDSPCRNAGDGTILQVGDTDADGQLRIQDTSVDMGADESDGTSYSISPVIIRVSPTGNDANDGSTWALAKQTIQAGIEAAHAVGGEVWVKAGAYNGCINLRPWAYLYGGFAGTETARSQRNWTSNASIIDGQDIDAVIRVYSAHMLSTIDGLTIRNGSTVGTGGGICCNTASLVIANNVITSNNSSHEGGGISCTHSHSTITGNTITSNTAGSTDHPAYGGGGICISYSSAIAVTGNTISSNVGGYGGGIYAKSAIFSASNNLISSNTARYSSGGGIYLSQDAIATLVNNRIAGNTAIYEGGGLYCGTYSTADIVNNTIVSNTITSDPSSTSHTGGIQLTNGSAGSVMNNIIAFNSSGISKLGGSPVQIRNNDVYGNTYYNYNGAWTGTNDISYNPLFVDMPGGNYHLTSRSRLLNKGYNSAPSLPATDMDGQGRIYNTTVDIGADEYQP